MRFEQRLLDDSLKLVYWDPGEKTGGNGSDSNESELRFLLVHTPFHRLALECQSVKFEMPLKLELEEGTSGLSNVCCPLTCFQMDTQGYAWLHPWADDNIAARFNLARLNMYKDSNDDKLPEFFRPAVASFLTHHILINTNSEEEDNIDRGMATKGLSYLLNRKAYVDAFTLHPCSPEDPSSRLCSTAHDICLPKLNETSISSVTETADVRHDLADTWSQWFRRQPLNEIRNYFGEKYAFYFAWLGLLTFYLAIPAVLGSVVFVFGVIYSSNNENMTTFSDWMVGCFDNRATPVFSIIICVWGTVFVELWKRRQARLQYMWHVYKLEGKEPIRPQFAGKLQEDPVTKQKDKVDYSRAEKRSKLAGSGLFVAFMILLVLASLVAVTVYRLIFEHDWLTDDAVESLPGSSLLPTLTASLIQACIILLLKVLYRWISWQLTRFENHRTQSQFDASLVVKLFAFNFANSYVALFYIAFFRSARYEKGFVGLGSKYRDSCGDTNDCMTMLTVQVAVLMVVLSLHKFAGDYLWPWIKKKWNEYRDRKNKQDGDVIELGHPGMTQGEKELIQHIIHQRQLPQLDMQKWDNYLLTEYSDKVIMYGYLMIFAAAFPLAPLLALIVNLLYLRLGDAKRLMWKTRRPIVQIAKGIGIWQKLMYFINAVAVISNGFLIAFTSDFGKEIGERYGQDGRLWLLVVFEHATFIFMLVVVVFVPDVPHDVQVAKRRDKVVIDQAIAKTMKKPMVLDTSVQA